jgi:hypothetical protein
MNLRLAFPALVLLAAARVEARPEEPGFGGAGSEGQTPSPGPDEGCVIKDDDGVWRTCDEVLQKKSKASEAIAPPIDESPEARKLREQMKAIEAAKNEPPAPPPKTKLEIDLEKAHLDPKLPLLALRIEVERAQQVVKALEDKGRGGKEREEAEARLARLQDVLDDVERIGVHRMMTCSQRTGRKQKLTTYRMTPGGPVLLTTREVLARLPLVDPGGCERIVLVDQRVVDRVSRLHELKHILATTSFGYREVEQRWKLEEELKRLETELAAEAIPAAPSRRR